MQTKRTHKNRPETTRRRGRSNRSLQQARQSVESNIARKAIGGSVFRPDLLDLNLTTKSGFLIPELGFDDKPFENKSQIIESWYATLKKHPKVKVLMVDENASLNDVLDLLKATTDDLFKGYDWVLDFCQITNECSIYYYESKDCASLFDMSIEFIDCHKNPLIKELGLYMIKGLSKKFGIDYVTSSWNYELGNYSTEKELRRYFVEDLGHDEFELEEDVLFNCYLTYINGRPYQLEKELKNMNFSIKIYTNRLELIKESHTRIYNWLKKGLEILKDDFSFSDYEFDPDNLTEGSIYNTDLVQLNQCFWFPWRDNDPYYERTFEVIDEHGSNCGVNEVYEWGYLKMHSERTPVSYNKLENLYQFFITGNKLNPLKIKKR